MTGPQWPNTLPQINDIDHNDRSSTTPQIGQGFCIMGLHLCHNYPACKAHHCDAEQF